jgi:hypothetical protein
LTKATDHVDHVDRVANDVSIGQRLAIGNGTHPARQRAARSSTEPFGRESFMIQPSVDLLKIFGLGIAMGVAACSGQTPDVSWDEEYEIGTNEEPLSAVSNTLWKPAFGSTKVVIPVCFVSGTDMERNFVKIHAESSWEGIASRRGNTNYGVDFTGWGICPAITTGTLRIGFSATADTSFTIGSGPQSTYPDPGMIFRITPTTTLGPSFAAIVIHEFGHVLSFTHEFLRPDYIPTCTPAGEAPNPDLGLTVVDRRSIMSAELCGRAGTLTILDETGFVLLYGPLTIGPSSTVVLRHDSSSRFVRVSSGGVPYVDSAGITANTDLGLESAESNGVIAINGRVRLRAPSGQYVIETSSFVTDTRHTTDSRSIWRIRHLTKSSGSVFVNDNLILESSTGRYLNIGSSNRLATSPSITFWRMLRSGIHF